MSDDDQKTGTCALCLDSDETVRFDHICLCKSCANAPIPLFTAWISLGQYSNKKHSLLQFIEGSHQVDYSHIDEKSTMEKEVPKNLPIRNRWRFGSHGGLQIGDMLLFNCKTVHRAQPAQNVRASVDVRFGILPDRDKGDWDEKLNRKAKPDC